MGDVNHITRNYRGTTVTRDTTEYFKLEIESYNPQNSFTTYSLNPSPYNCKKAYKDGLHYYTSKNERNSWKYTINKGFNKGTYRIEAIIFSTKNTNQFFDLNLQKGDGTTVYLKNRNTTTSRYEGLNRLDLGLIEIEETMMCNINVSATLHSKLVALIFKQVRKYSGDTKNDGELTIKEAKSSNNGKIGDTTLSFKILHRQGTADTGGYEEERNASGLVFEYRDMVNAYIRDVDGVLQQVFGGYISDAILSDDNMTINISCAERGVDGNKRSILKELTIGGALPTNNLSETCNDLYDGLKYLAAGVETPYKLGNITSIVNSIPNKTGFFWDLSNNSNARKVTRTNASVTVGQSTINIRNGRAAKKVTTNKETKEVGIPGQIQGVTLWDSSWNKTKEKVGYKLVDYPVFYLRYGMGKQGYSEDTKTYIPKQYDAMGNVVAGTGRYVTYKKADGFNTNAPGKWHLELHFTTQPTTPMNNRTADWLPGGSGDWRGITIEFTDTDISSGSDRGVSTSTSGGVHRINPIFSYNTLRTVAINLVGWMNNPAAPKYLRKVVLRYVHNSDSPLYDGKNNTDYRLLVQNFGFRQGEAYSPEVITTSGQKINDTLETIKKTLQLNSHWAYGKSRYEDVLYFQKQDQTISKYELEEGNNGNIIEISSISYPIVSDLCNSVVKVYKVPDQFYGYASSKDPTSLLRFSEHQNLEVLSEETGYNYANYLAENDQSKMKNMGYSYTITAKGYRNVQIGEYMVCTLLDSKLDDIQPVKSIEWTYNPEKRPMIRSTYGLGEMSDEMRAKTTLKNIRKGLPEKRTVFSGGSAEVIYNGL